MQVSIGLSIAILSLDGIRQFSSELEAMAKEEIKPSINNLMIERLLKDKTIVKRHINTNVRCVDPPTFEYYVEDFALDEDKKLVSVRFAYFDSDYFKKKPKYHQWSDPKPAA